MLDLNASILTPKELESINNNRYLLRNTLLGTTFSWVLGKSKYMTWINGGYEELNGKKYQGTLDWDSLGMWKAEPTSRKVGLSITLPYSKYKDACILNDRDTALFGEIPTLKINCATGENVQDLEKKYQNGELIKTGKKYTFDLSVNDEDEFKPDVYEEYLYRGHKYIRYTVRRDPFRYPKEEAYWVVVTPIQWSVFEKQDIMLSNSIVGGIRGVDAEYYINEYLINQILPTFTSFDGSLGNKVDDLIKYYFAEDSDLVWMKYHQILEIENTPKSILNMNYGKIVVMGFERDISEFYLNRNDVQSLEWKLKDYYKKNKIMIDTLKSIDEYFSILNRSSSLITSSQRAVELSKALQNSFSNIRKVYDKADNLKEADEAFKSVTDENGFVSQDMVKEFLEGEYEKIVQKIQGKKAPKKELVLKSSSDDGQLSLNI